MPPISKPEAELRRRIAVELSRAGKSTAAIAKVIGVQPRQARRILAEARAQQRPVLSELAELRERVARLEELVQQRAQMRRRAPRQKPAAESDSLLDSIALGMAKKRFHKLSPAHQRAVVSLAERIRSGPAD